MDSVTTPDASIQSFKDSIQHSTGQAVHPTSVQATESNIKSQAINNYEEPEEEETKQ